MTRFEVLFIMAFHAKVQRPSKWIMMLALFVSHNTWANSTDGNFLDIASLPPGTTDSPPTSAVTEVASTPGFLDATKDSRTVSESDPVMTTNLKKITTEEVGTSNLDSSSINFISTVSNLVVGDTIGSTNKEDITTEGTTFPGSILQINQTTNFTEEDKQEYTSLSTSISTEELSDLSTPPATDAISTDGNFQTSIISIQPTGITTLQDTFLTSDGTSRDDDQSTTSAPISSGDLNHSEAFDGDIVSTVGYEGKASQSDDTRWHACDSVTSTLCWNYNLIVHFLEEFVQKNYLSDFVENSEGAQERSIASKDLENWVFVMKFFAGYIICVSIGAVLFVIVPLSGCILCCCRCCRKRKLQEELPPVCAHGCCGFFLCCSLAVMLFLTVLIFVSLTTVHSRLSRDGVVWKDMNTAITDGDEYINNSSEQVFDIISTQPMAQISVAFEKYERTPNACIEKLQQDSDLPSSMARMKNIATEMYTIVTLLDDVMKRKDDYELQFLFSNATNLINMLYSHLSMYNTTQCDEIVDLIFQSNTSLIQTIELSSPDISEVASKVSNCCSTIVTAINNSQTAISDGAVYLQDEMSESLKHAQSSISAYKAMLSNASAVLSLETPSMNLSALKEKVSSLSRDSQFATYFQMGYWTVMSVLLTFCLIILLYLIGLLCGCFAKQVNDEDDMEDVCCPQHTCAPAFLFSGVVLTFLLFAVYVATTSALFGFGGLSHTELCRHLVNREGSPKSEKVLVLYKEYLSSLHNYSSEDLDFFMDIFLTCRRNESISSALKLDHTKIEDHIQQILDKTNETFSTYQDRSNTLKFPKIYLLDSNISAAELAKDTEESLIELRDSVQLRTMDMQRAFHTYSAILQNISTAVDDVPASNTGYSGKQNVLSLIENTTEQLKATVEELQSKYDILTLRVQAALGLRPNEMAMQTLEENTNTKGSRYLEECIMVADANFTRSAWVTSVELSKIMSGDIIHCGSLHAIFTRVVDSVCVQTLYPLNAIWFAMGFSLLILLVGLTAAVCLADYHMKVIGYNRDNPAYDMGLEGPGYDAFCATDFWQYDDHPREILLEKMERPTHRYAEEPAPQVAAFDNAVFTPDEISPRPTAAAPEIPALSGLLKRISQQKTRHDKGISVDTPRVDSTRGPNATPLPKESPPPGYNNTDEFHLRPPHGKTTSSTDRSPRSSSDDYTTHL